MKDDSNQASEMNPEDKIYRRRANEYATARGAGFVALYRERIDALVLTYSDRLAEETLEELREMFWAQTWLADPDDAYSKAKT